MDEIEVLLDDAAYPPVRAHEEDAGMDLRTPYAVFIPAGGFVSIDTGVHMFIPNGYYGKLESKSGLNVKHQIVSHGGVIDSGYTGSIVAKLYNHSNKGYTFERGDKVIQIVIQKCELPTVKIVDDVPETDRGSDGFGSTGK